MQLRGRPYHFVGANFFPAMVGAAAGGDYRANVTAVLAAMQRMQLKVLRTWAFNDGAGWQALQTNPGLYNETVFRYGGYGGAPQYVNWTGLSSMNDFYTSSSIRRAFKANIHTVLTRNNSFTGVTYRNDPSILAWELANEVANFGDSSGDTVQAWLEDISAYVKLLDRNHLVSSGGGGSFGASTPQYFNLASYGPNVYGFPLNNGSPYPFTQPTCSGEDFSRNGGIPGIDLLSYHLYPDFAILCDLQCQLKWAQQQLDAHIDAAAAVGKPLLLGEFNKLPPVADRNAFLDMVLGTLQRAVDAGKPIAGSGIWNLAASATFPGYAGEYDSFSVYTDPSLALLPPSNTYAAPKTFALQNAQFAQYANWNASLQCNTRRAAGPGRANYADGANETLAILSRHAAAT